MKTINIETSKEAAIGYGMGMETAALLCEVRNRPAEAKAIRGIKNLMLRSASWARARSKRSPR